MISEPTPSEPVALPTRMDAAERWLALGVRLAAIYLMAVVALRIPLPLVGYWLPAREVVVAATAVLWSGKCLYDTFFFDRY